MRRFILRMLLCVLILSFTSPVSASLFEFKWTTRELKEAINAAAPFAYGSKTLKDNAIDKFWVRPTGLSKFSYSVVESPLPGDAGWEALPLFLDWVVFQDYPAAKGDKYKAVALVTDNRTVVGNFYDDGAIGVLMPESAVWYIEIDTPDEISGSLTWEWYAYGMPVNTTGAAAGPDFSNILIEIEAYPVPIPPTVLLFLSGIIATFTFSKRLLRLSP